MGREAEKTMSSGMGGEANMLGKVETTDSGPTPADDMAPQINTDCGNFILDFKHHGLCASPLFLQTLGPWFPNEMQNLLSSEKRTLDHCGTDQVRRF